MNFRNNGGYGPGIAILAFVSLLVLAIFALWLVFGGFDACTLELEPWTIKVTSCQYAPAATPTAAT